ncbi:MAG: ArsA family ATPase [Ilumatobacteraceae bacterium]
MTTPRLIDRRLLFVTGKGGVGKSSIAGALARVAAGEGKRTLVVEMDAKGALAQTLNQSELTFSPREVSPNLFAMAMNTEDALREYLKLFVRIPFITSIGPLAKMFDFVAQAAPGVKEILAVGKLCWEVRERHYDVVIVDAEATGHIVAQVDAPASLARLVQVGIIRDQTRWMQEIVHDAQTTGVVVVTTPEEMPVIETMSLIDTLTETTKVPVAGVVANRVYDDVASPDDRRILREILAALASSETPLARDVRAVGAVATLSAERRESAEEHLATLAAYLKEHHVPLTVVADLRVASTKINEALALALAEELT